MNARSFTPESADTSSGSEKGKKEDAVRVILRCRPLNETEQDRQDSEVVRVDVSSNQVAVVVPGPGGRDNRKNFSFNKAVGPDCLQEQFFNCCGVKTLLDSALNGYPATVFAYGQTGSGKTFSMSGIEERIATEEWSGSDSADGVIPRSVRYLFEQVHELSQQSAGHTKFTVRASYCEIYNEQVYDLLNLSSDCLPVRWNVKNGFFVQGLFVVECEELSDVMAVVSEGHRNRRVGTHELNKDSSRSHSLLTVYVESELIDPDDGHCAVKFGKVVFVDLAGSERLKDTKSEGTTLTETGAINKSLFTLSKVISCLSDKRGAAKAGGFIPYRDSKLTKLLMDSLGGNSLTLMIACCSPSSAYLDETVSTLNYATRAKRIKNKPTVQIDPKEELIITLKQEVRLLRSENGYLREQCGAGQLQLEGGGGGGGGGESVYAPSVGGYSAPGSQYGNEQSGNSFGARSSVLSVAGSTATSRHMGMSKSSVEVGAQPPGALQSSRRAFGSAVIPTRQPFPPSSSRSGVGIGGVVSFPPPGLSQPHGGASNAVPAHGSPRMRHLTDPQQHQYQQQGDGTGGGGGGGGGDRFGESNVNNVSELMDNFRGELDRLRAENDELRLAKSVQERTRQSAMMENERLASKLEQLEEIFVHRGGQDHEKWSKGEPANSGATRLSDSHAMSGEATKNDEQQKNMMRAIRGLSDENSTLRRKIKLLEHDVVVLSPKSHGSPTTKSFASIGSEPGVGQGTARSASRLRAENAQLTQQIEGLQKSLWERKALGSRLHTGSSTARGTGNGSNASARGMGGGATARAVDQLDMDEQKQY